MLRRIVSQFQKQFIQMAPAARFQLVVVPLLVIAGLGYLVLRNDDAATTAVLSGKAFSIDELRDAESALKKEGLTDYQIDGRRILAPKSSAEKYNTLLSKAERGANPSTGDEFEKVLDPNPLFSGTSSQRGERMDFARSQRLTRMIRNLAYIADAELVWSRPQPRGFHPTAKMTAVLTVEPKSGADLTAERADALRQMIAGGFGMQPENITILDRRTGKTAPMAGSAADLETESPTQPTDSLKQIEQMIAESLADVPGVHVVAERERESVTFRRANRSTAELMNVTVAIPAEFYRTQLKRQGIKDLNSAKVQSRLKKLQAAKERDVRERIRRIAPLESQELSLGQVTITTDPDQDAETESEARFALVWVESQWEMVVILGGLASVGFLIFSVFRRKKPAASAKKAKPALPEDFAAKMAEAEKQLAAKTFTKPVAPRDRLQELVKENPELVAAAIGHWLEQSHWVGTE